MEQIQGYQFAIDLNDNGMTRSLRSLRDEAKLLRSAMQANFAEVRSGEGIMAAYSNKIEDAKRAIEGQRAYIERLKKEQDGLDLSTDKGRQAYVKYENQINTAKRAIASLEAQEKRATNALNTHKSGVLQLRDAVETSKRVNENYVTQLEAEGRKYAAQQAKVKGLIDVRKKMGEQLSAEKGLLAQVEQTSGKMSKAYQEQAVRVAELSTKYVQNEKAIRESNVKTLDMSNTMIKFRDKVGSAGETAKNAFNKIKEHAYLAAGTVGGLGKLSIDGAKKASEVSSQYQVIYNNLITSGESAAEATEKVKQMQEDGVKYSVKYGISQKEIADGYLELVKRGYSSTQALGAMNTELQGSIASGDDFSDVIKVASQTLEGFQMNVDKSGNPLKSVAEMSKQTKIAVNELAYTADVTSTDFQSLGKGMEYVNSTAHQAKFSLSETSAAMGILSNNGLEADKALVKLAA